MTQLIERRWTRSGTDRVYVTTPQGDDVGHVDLLDGTVVVNAPDFEAELQDCLWRWTNIPGAAEIEPDWLVAAKGQHMIALELAKLAPEWRVLSSIEIGDSESGIDHLAIGPAGVATIMTRRHPNAKVWVGEHGLKVNGLPVDYLGSSRFEAHRTARVLSAATGAQVPVSAAIAFVDLDGFVVKQMPKDVHVTTRAHLSSWVQSLPTTIDAEMIDRIHTHARSSVVWSG